MLILVKDYSEAPVTNIFFARQGTRAGRKGHRKRNDDIHFFTLLKGSLILCTTPPFTAPPSGAVFFGPATGFARPGG